MARVIVSVSLDSEKDERLVQWWDSLPGRRRSAAVRDALTAYLDNEVTLADVLRAVQDLKQCGVTVAQEPKPKPESKPVRVSRKALQNLDSLGQ